MAIVEHFRDQDLDPAHVPGTLLPFHAPFAWGDDARQGRRERHHRRGSRGAGLADRGPQPPGRHGAQSIVDKHFQRKHGKDAYYGQPKS